MASAPPAPRAIPPLPFASPHQLDQRLQEFLEQASQQLCAWLASASSRGPLPALSVLPGVEPEQGGLANARLLADLQQV
ncbi:aspartate aminotransferase family protein, partial [Cyanobium sp. LEGE 06143]|nr:aspartate aminotransferase family protein [Cyanobium sp. LEGE 06143]